TTRTVRRIMRHYLHQIGIHSHRLTTHSLRHSAVTIALEEGASLQEAQATARHVDLATTLIYAHNLDRIEHAGERRISVALEKAKKKKGGGFSPSPPTTHQTSVIR